MDPLFLKVNRLDLETDVAKYRTKSLVKMFLRAI